MSDRDPGDGVRPWRTLSVQDLLDCRIFAVRKVRRENSSGEKQGDFYLVHSRDWVNVVAITAERQIVLIRQYRHGSDEILLEIPGGILDGDESPAQAGRRELLEETGYECDDVIEIGRVRPNPALFDNWQYAVLATNARPTGATAFDEHEEIDVELRPVEHLDEMIASGEITHALVLNALTWYRLHTRSETAKRTDAKRTDGPAA